MNAYKCYYEDCLKIYNSKYNLIRHINSFHLDNKSYMCSSCNKGFYNKQSLEVHAKQCMNSCDLLIAQGSGILVHISYILDNKVLYLKPTPPMQLPILARIERDRQIPFCYIKLPIIGTIFGNEEIKD